MAEDLFRRLNGKKYLSKIDLTKGYSQILVAAEDVYKTAFVTWSSSLTVFQENEVKLYPVGYVSKKLSLAEAKYPIIEKECLAEVWGIRCFKPYLAGKRFTL